MNCTIIKALTETESVLYVGCPRTGRGSFTSVLSRAPFHNAIDTKNIANEKFKTIVSVRNPYLRAVSLYLADRLKERQSGYPSFSEWCKTRLGTIPTISDTIDKLNISTNIDYIRLEWAPEDIQRALGYNIQMPVIGGLRTVKLDSYYREWETQELVRKWGQKDFELGKYHPESHYMADTLY